MSLQQLVVGVSDGASWADTRPDNPTTAGAVSLRETLHLLFVILLLSCVTLALLTSTAVIDAVLRMVAGIG
jgi:4-hydroxybenzoate polyprenyltransferase